MAPVPGEEAGASADNEEQALRRTVVASIDAFFRILAADSTSVRLAESHVGKFLSDAYDVAAAKKMLLLKKVDLEMNLTAEELLGQSLSLLDCFKLCRELKNEAACKLYNLVLQRQGKEASDIEAAAIFIADKETMIRAMAKMLFGGEVTQYGVDGVYVSDGKVHVNLAIRSQNGADVSDAKWQFHMAFAHNYWHITDVTKEGAGAGSTPVDAGHMVKQTSL
jgi:hypothetical protein